MTKKDSFLQKLKFKYKLTILNENTLEEAWHIRLSRLNVFLICFAIAVLYFFFIAFLIMKTPLRTFMPNYTDMNVLKKQVLNQALALDSIQEQAAKNQIYLDMLTKVVSGDIETKDSSATLDDIVKVELEKVKLDPSSRENSFCSKYEIAQKYSNDTKASAESQKMLMHRPSLGVVLKPYDSSVDRIGVTLAVDPLGSVYSVMDGHVIFEGYSAHNRYCMQIQHANNMISTYKFTHPFLKQIGDFVKAGEILATHKEETGSEITFELWSNGMPINPQEYISFSTGTVVKEDLTKKKKMQKYQAVPTEKPVVVGKPMVIDSTKVKSKPMKKEKTNDEATEQPIEQKDAVQEQTPIQVTPAPAPAQINLPAPTPQQKNMDDDDEE